MGGGERTSWLASSSVEAVLVVKSTADCKNAARHRSVLCNLLGGGLPAIQHYGITGLRCQTMVSICTHTDVNVLKAVMLNFDGISVKINNDENGNQDESDKEAGDCDTGYAQ